MPRTSSVDRHIGGEGRDRTPDLGRASARRTALSPIEERESRKSAERTDEELVEGIRRSNEADFNLLYERYYQRVYNFSYLRLRNHADTEEVVQETFTAVFSLDRRLPREVVAVLLDLRDRQEHVNNHIRRSVAREQRVDRAESELVRNLRISQLACTPEEQLTLPALCGFHSRSVRLARRLAGRDLRASPRRESAHRRDRGTKTSRSNDAVRSSLCRVKRLLVEAVESWPGRRGRAPGMERSSA